MDYFVQSKIRSHIRVAAAAVYEGGLKSSQADYGAAVKFGLFFNIVYIPCSPQTSFISVAALGFPWYRSPYPDPRGGGGWGKCSTAGMTSV